MIKIPKEKAARLKLHNALQEYSKELSHFYECIDFGKSHLDARAVTFMNVGLGEFYEEIMKIVGGI